MTLLNQVLRGRLPAPRRVMLYGVHGIGKSTFGAMAPKPIFIQTEDGLGEIDCDRFPLATAYEQVIDSLAELLNENHAYQTVVIDSLDWLEQLIWSDVCRERGVVNIEDIPYAKGFTLALTRWRKFLDRLSDLRAGRGMLTVRCAQSYRKI